MRVANDDGAVHSPIDRSITGLTPYPRRATIGARIRITPDVHVQAGVLRNFARTPGPDDAFSAVIPSTAFDLAVSVAHRF
jgi:hypothetical protein